MSTSDQLVRPDRRLALHVAERMFLAGERVEMRTLAGRLGVGRTTLYRWVGDREQVLAEVLAGLTTQLYADSIARAEGEGVERALDAIRRFVEVSSRFEPLRQFVEREPAAALRVLMKPDGPVADALRVGVGEALVSSLPEHADRITPEVVDVMVQVGTALEWIPVVIGEPSAVDRAISLGRMLLGVVLVAPPGTGAPQIV